MVTLKIFPFLAEKSIPSGETRTQNPDICLATRCLSKTIKKYPPCVPAWFLSMFWCPGWWWKVRGYFKLYTFVKSNKMYNIKFIVYVCKSILGYNLMQNTKNIIVKFPGLESLLFISVFASPPNHISDSQYWIWSKLLQGVGFEPTQSFDYQSLNLTP